MERSDSTEGSSNKNLFRIHSCIRILTTTSTADVVEGFRLSVIIIYYISLGHYCLLTMRSLNGRGIVIMQIGHIHIVRKVIINHLISVYFPSNEQTICTHYILYNISILINIFTLMRLSSLAIIIKYCDDTKTLAPPLPFGYSHRSLFSCCSRQPSVVSV